MNIILKVFTLVEKTIIFGYNVKDALHRANLAPIEWGVVYVEYVD